MSPSAPIPSDWKGFLRNDANKQDLFAFLAKEIEKCKVSGKQIVSTCHENVVCSSGDISLGNLAPCTQEEADTRLLLHAADCVRQKHSIIIIRTSDTDVVVLAFSLSQQLGAKELWTSFETGKHFRFIAIHDIVSKLGPDKCKALPVFHAITGCDTVSFIAGRGKLKAWEAWMAFPPVTQGFLKLAACKEEIGAPTPETLEQFIVLMYPWISQFSKGNRSIKNIPPTSDALHRHVLRAAYQGAFVWSQCLEKEPQLPSPSSWGWKKGEQYWQSVWMTHSQAQDACYELIRCGCKKGCRDRCKCAAVHLQCTALCSCWGDCSQY